jgi:RHS repeat-associated protein
MYAKDGSLLRIRPVPPLFITSYDYKLNGKELQDELGLNMYDYGNRLYDPARAGWSNIDPLAENSRRWSPYNYCYNNPIHFVDPDGMQADDWRINYTDKNGKQQTFNYTGKETNLPDNQFVKDFVGAYQYNVGNGGGDAMKEIAENKNIIVDVRETEALSYADHSPNILKAGNYNEVSWAPNVGLETTNGVVMSPATLLEHEADHALRFAKTPGTAIREGNLPRENYDNKEEQRAIQGNEQKTALKNGEIKPGQVTRNDHYGLPVITNSPTSNKVNVKATGTYLKENYPNIVVPGVNKYKYVK